MTLKNDILEELKKKLKYTRDSRDAILDQLKLKDVQIDKIDVLTIKNTTIIYTNLWAL